MRIAFIDHAFHQKTRSTLFFPQLLFPNETVEFWWDADWEGGAIDYLDAVEARGYDLIIVFQLVQVAFELARRARRNPGLHVVFVPMWDNCLKLGPEYWGELASIRMVSFARTLHQRLRGHGLASAYAQFFPDPAGLPVVEDYTARRGFFWQRIAPISWPHVRAAIGGSAFQSFHLHRSPDPDEAIDPEQALPHVEEAARLNLTTSTWFASAADYHAALAAANVFFAPRLHEGIGMSFLEAMAMGMCVVAHRAPTMNEYIADGANGLLVDFCVPAPVALERFAELGRRARATVLDGHARWIARLPSLRDYMLKPWTELAPEDFGYERALVRTSTASFPPEALPKVSVVTVTRNCADVLEGTIKSVIAQDYPDLEYLIIDGVSTDGTLDVIRRHAGRLSGWLSEPDLGTYDAMNKAALRASGKYILFMNAGDRFFGTDAITRALTGAPAGADFIIGHHIYHTATVEELRQAADFEVTWARLVVGAVDPLWLDGFPCHQATLTRTELLRRHRYDCRYRVAADHEFMYRMRRAGARFHHSLETLAVYVAGGLSDCQRLRTLEEWVELAARYGGPGALAFFCAILADEAPEHADEAGSAAKPWVNAETVGNALIEQAGASSLRPWVEGLVVQVFRDRAAQAYLQHHLDEMWASGAFRLAQRLRALRSRFPLLGRLVRARQRRVARPG